MLAMLLYFLRTNDVNLQLAGYICEYIRLKAPQHSRPTVAVTNVPVS